MNVIWHDLVVNFAIVSLFLSVWRHFRHSIAGYGVVSRRVVFGVLMGAAAVASMYLSIPVADGVIFDLRNGVVVIAAGFGGPIGGLVAALIAGAFRIWVGGVGMFAGVSGIAFTTAVGLAVHSSRRGGQSNFWHVLAMAVGAALSFFVATASLPFGWGTDAFFLISLPVGIMLLLTTFAMGWMLLKSQRSGRERDLLRAATVQSPDYRYIKDKSSRFVAANLATAKINGFDSPRDLLGLSDFDLDYSRASHLFEAEQVLMQGGEDLLNIIDTMDDENGKRWFSTSKVALRGPDGEVIGMVGVTRDVTEEKRLEISLEQTRNRLEFALAEMSDGLAVYDDDARLVFCNERYLSMFPLSAHMRVPGTHMRDILKEAIKTGEQVIASPDEAEFWIDSIVENLRQHSEEQTQMYDGRWLSVRTRPAKAGNSMVLVTDVTQAKLAELELIRSAERLKALAETDSLTGLSNRRAFDSALQLSLTKAQDNRAHLSLLMIDIDHFKAYNDSLGHAAGDECLRQVAQLLQQSVTRSVDVVARYGGEEFALVLVGANLVNALNVADNLQETLKLANLPHDSSPLGRISVSIGVAQVMHGSAVDTPDDLINRADQALYAAKRAGRNRTNSWDENLEQDAG